jgi:hypothetical protein
LIVKIQHKAGGLDFSLPKHSFVSVVALHRRIRDRSTPTAHQAAKTNYTRMPALCQGFLRA